ncbi:hypothetical protein V6N11_031282 [Hibiscus sabdariffa]|uniref:Uncharacterized protein n=1 Tax=Hibiscus sabdariffa TaxID=183260 RepID=A0ABR2SXG4_9ROSI
MSDISSLMANLRFTDEDLEGMDALQFEDDHHVEGLDKWIVEKVDSAQPKITTIRRSQPGIVITKKDAGFANQPIPKNNKGALVDRTVQSERGKGSVIGTPKAKNSTKRLYNHKDGKGLHLASKKARPLQPASGNNVEEGQEETPPQIALTSVEAVEQPRRES